MNPTLIVLVLMAIGVGLVVWVARRKPGPPPTAGNDRDTAWNDPLTPAAPDRTIDPVITPSPGKPEA